ncbi:STM3941 family protein [Marinicrinis lubricantis]
MLYTYGNQKFIGLVLRDPEPFLTRQSWLKRKLIQINVKMMNTPINIAQSGLPVKLDDLYSVIRYRWRASQNHPPEED